MATVLLHPDVTKTLDSLPAGDELRVLKIDTRDTVYR